MRYRCYRCPCPKRPGEFCEFDADAPSCPKCGAGEPAVLELVAVHMLLPDPAGPIGGGMHGRWRVGCQPRRDALATHPGDTFAASPDARAVTCPSCRGLPAYAEQARKIKELQNSFGIAEGGCC